MRRLYFLIIFMCLAIGSVWADTGLSILGQEVPTTNSWNAWAVSLQNNATGTFSYDASTKTLTLTDVDVPTSSKVVISNKSVKDLRIVFKGNCYLFSSNKVITYDVKTSLEGSASTEVALYSYDDEEAIYCNARNYDYEDAGLTISSFPKLYLDSKNDYSISYAKGQVIIEDSHVTMRAGKGTIHGNNLGFSVYRTTLKDCYFEGNYKMVSNDNHPDYDVAVKKNASGDNLEVVKEAVIIRSSEYSGVRLNGVAVLATDSRWNASQKTLTLNANVSGTSYTYPAGITVEKPGITINGGGKTASGTKYGLEQTCAGSSSEVTTIRNISLSGSYSGTYVQKYINNNPNNRYTDAYKSTYLRIEDDVVLAATDYAVFGGNVTFAPSGGKTVTLQPLITANWAYPYFRGQKAVIAYDLALEDCDIAYPEGATVNDSTIVSGTSPWYMQAIIKGWQKYNLYVNGTQVNEKNKDNLAGLLGSNATGTLKYNPNTQTLTMNNLKANISSSATNGDLIRTQYGNLTIAVEGENEIQTTSNSNIYHIWTGGSNFTIQGTGPYASKLTLKGNQQYAFISVFKPVIKDVRLNIEGNGTQNGIESRTTNTEGTISNANVSIKNAKEPLSGRWMTSGVQGYLSNNNQKEISFNPDTKQLVYLDENGPTSNLVTKEDVTIFPTGSYTLTVNGSTPQSYTPADGVCFDEFSNRLYLRNAYLYRSIVADMSLLKIHTIGSSEVSVSGTPISVTADNLIFQGPGSLSLWSTSDNNTAAQIYGKGNVQIPGMYTTVQIKNTTLNLKGKVGMAFNPSAGSKYGMLYVTGSSVKADCLSGGVALLGFYSMNLTDCTLYTPEGGYYSNNMLRNADGSATAQMIILTDAPDVVVLNAFDNNDNVLMENYDKSVSVCIKNLTIKGDGSWRTICLPFSLELQGSVLQGCEVRELTGARLEGNIGVLDFTKEVDKIAPLYPYIIRNTSGTDIINPNFGIVTILNHYTIHQYSRQFFDGVVVKATYNYLTGGASDIYILDGSPVLVPQNGYVTFKGFEPVFQLTMDGAQYYVIDTGHGEVDDLIDGIETVDTEPACGAVYDLSGRKYDALPNKSGIYIRGGKKVVIK